jgi:predicted histidine transporter YuiF (NhaC family)
MCEINERANDIANAMFMLSLAINFGFLLVFFKYRDSVRYWKQATVDARKQIKRLRDETYIN